MTDELHQEMYTWLITDGQVPLPLRLIPFINSINRPRIPLLIVIGTGNYWKTKHLIELGVDVNQVPKFTLHPLYLCIYLRDITIFKLLLDKGVDLNRSIKLYSGDNSLLVELMYYHDYYTSSRNVSNGVNTTLSIYSSSIFDIIFEGIQSKRYVISQRTLYRAAVVAIELMYPKLLYQLINAGLYWDTKIYGIGINTILWFNRKICYNTSYQIHKAFTTTVTQIKHNIGENGNIMLFNILNAYSLQFAISLLQRRYPRRRKLFKKSIEYDNALTEPLIVYLKKELDSYRVLVSTYKSYAVLSKLRDASCKA
jgi:hypothetical protein